MTPFMIRVAELLETDVDEALPLPVPATVPSRPVRVNRGADKQVAIRALAEQLVCEANAVLGDAEDHLSLTDELTDGNLSFCVAFRGREARVTTSFQDSVAVAHLTGDGVVATEPRELAGTEALPDLLLLLIAESDAPRHPAVG